MFDWKTDRELFINGPFECRIVEAVPEEVGAEVPLQWQRWLRERYGTMLDSYSSLSILTWWIGPTIEEDRPHVDIEEDDDGTPSYCLHLNFTRRSCISKESSFPLGMSPLLQGSLVGLVLAIIAGVALYAFRSRNPSTH